MWYVCKLPPQKKNTNVFLLGKCLCEDGQIQKIELDVFYQPFIKKKKGCQNTQIVNTNLSTFTVKCHDVLIYLLA